MKKVNLLLVVMHLNTLLLLLVCLYILSESKAIVAVNDENIENLNRLFEYLPTIFWIWIPIFCIISVIIIISIIIDFKKNKTKVLYKKMKRVKIGLIPFWIMNFICYIPISFVLIVIGHGLGFFIVPFFVLGSYIVLLLSSLFSIAYLFNLRRNHVISTKKAMIHSIMQLFFVIDIIDTIYIIRKLNKVK